MTLPPRRRVTTTLCRETVEYLERGAVLLLPLQLTALQPAFGRAGCGNYLKVKLWKH